MKLSRRLFAQLAGAAVAAPAVPHIALALDYPTRPVHVVVGFPPGGVGDILARVLGQWLSERLGQPFVIDNRPGAATNIAAEAVVRAPPDGYTLLWVTTANAINATLYDNLNFDFVRDIALVAGVNRMPDVMEINPVVPAKTVPEFLAYAKANPGKLNYAALNGTTNHVAGELFKLMAGVDMVHIPYQGPTQALTDLLAGRVHVMFDNLPTSIAYIKTGQLRALAVTSATRSDVLPDIPTVGEFVPGYEAIGWQGVGAPRNTPVEIVDKLNMEINIALADPEMQARIADLGGTVFVSSPAEFTKFVAAETEKWGKVVKFSGAKAG
jgi:tripartite-type tricarboxylate transporter receptor subunit TctC